ncbi:MAG: hypothetical protein VX944_13785 [Myxococcota bacterium]|nr:hypothetical protein [Myxococcota bacterium]
MGAMTPTIKRTVALALVAMALAGLARWTGSPSSVWLLLLEPWLFAAAVAAMAGLALERKQTGAIGVAALVIGGSLILRSPVAFDSPPVDRPRHLRELKGCAVLARDPAGPVRVAVWTVESARATDTGIDAMLELKPDIVVLRGTDRPGVAMRLQDALSGEAKVSATPTGGLITVTRGNFQYCGGEEDAWTFDLPSLEGRPSMGVVSFPYVDEVGVIPLVVGQVEGPVGLADAFEWTQRVHSGAATTAAAVGLLGGANVVAVTDFFAPPHAMTLAQPLTQAGLRWASSGPNWPQRVGSVPEMGQHPLDQVWVGPKWTVQNTRVVAGSGHQRAPVVVDLVSSKPRGQR